MTVLDSLRSPLGFLQNRLPQIQHLDLLEAEQQWWKTEGATVSGTIDRTATPWLRMFDKSGKRTDEILYPGELEARSEAKNRAEGLRLPADTLTDLQKRAGEFGVPASF